MLFQDGEDLLGGQAVGTVQSNSGIDAKRATSVVSLGRVTRGRLVPQELRVPFWTCQDFWRIGTFLPRVQHPSSFGLARCNLAPSQLCSVTND